MSDKGMQPWADQFGPVPYDIHIAAVAEAEQRGYENGQVIHRYRLENYTDGIKTARDAVVEVSQHDHPDIDPLEVSTPFDYAKAICEAAIDGVKP